MKLGSDPRKWLEKKARLGNRGYPMGSVAYYGPDDRRATKVAVGVVFAEGHSADVLERWFAETSDARDDRGICAEVVALLKRHHVRSVVMSRELLGCPHEEGVDYPDGATCPKCPYWERRDRWAAATASIASTLRRGR